MDKYAKKFQQKIINILKTENMRAIDFARRCNLTKDVIYDYRNGRAGPSAENVLKICHQFPHYTCYLLDLPKKFFNKR
jgi:predicted transcriptional regulator